MTIKMAKPRADDIAEAIRKRICLDVQDGQGMLLEGALAEEFGVSRTPVRQALQRLTYEGLIEVRAGVGSVISAMEPSQRDMHFLVHGELLGLVARLPDAPVPTEIQRRLDMICAQVISGRSTDIESQYSLFTEFNALLSRLIPDPAIADAHLISGWRIVRWLLADMQTGQGKPLEVSLDRFWTTWRTEGSGRASLFREASNRFLAKGA
ncbi:winged helix-turn-helix domain-containing protein [Stappia sp. P2PMeth1]|uniref:GntR family transcriptional regulator n=1 Tax=Stappia sp. P2PMeth1 TaxID=2003586 RepID=UPI001FCA7294|nr:winged helix-turn-helix domain-containing protein [Stappia sp. P2PMeth1]